MTDLAPPHQSSLLQANLICMGSMLIWAAGLPAADRLIPLLPPEQLNALRMMLAGGFLVVLWAAVEGLGPLRRANWLKGIAVGSMIGLGAWFLIKGQTIGGAVTAAVISSTLPLVGITLEVVLDGRKVSLALLLGLALSLVGGVLALDLGAGGAAGGASMLWGALLCFGSVVTFAIGSRLTVTAFPDQTPIGRTAVTLFGAAVAALLVAGGQIATGTALPSFAAWGPKDIGAILLFSIGALGISQVMWIMSVERLGIGLSALHINAAPFYVMLILFALGAAWNWPQAFAAALVGLGVLFAQGIIPLPFGRRS